MHVLGHHHVADNRKVVGDASLFQNLEKKIAMCRSGKPWIALVAIDGDEMKMARTVVAMESAGH